MNTAKRLWMVATLVLSGWGCVSDPVPTTTQNGCGADDPRVGYIAELNSRLHGVSGTARIIDNCTIAIEHFNYDGIALDSRVVGVVNGDFKNVIVLSGPLMRAEGYTDETLLVPLPEGVTLDDVPVISISCLPGIDIFGEANFGEGTFHAP